MATVTVAAVQAAYVLMDQQACLDKAVALLHQAAGHGAKIVVFPEAFIPGTPIWIDSQIIWDGDADWYAMLVDQAVVVPGPVGPRGQPKCFGRVASQASRSSAIGRVKASWTSRAAESASTTPMRTAA